MKKISLFILCLLLVVPLWITAQDASSFQQSFTEAHNLIHQKEYAKAIEKLESWLLAIHGCARSEDDKQPTHTLKDQGVDPKNTSQMVALIEEKTTAHIPEDAISLKKWLARASAALSA